MVSTCVAVALVFGQLPAAVGFAAARRHVARLPSLLRAADTDALFAAQDAAMGRIRSALALEAKDYPASLGLDAFEDGTLAAYEGAGAPNVAWASDLRIDGAAVAVASLTVWCGPLADVPHLIARTTVTDDAVDVLVDWRPRAAVGYETALDDGTFPPPDSRDAFMAKGKRDDLEARFYGAARDVGAAFGGDRRPRPADARVAEMRSPACVDARAARSPEAIEAAADLAAAAVDLWLGWATDDAHALNPGMQVTSTYARDTKVRAANYALLADFFGGLFGDDRGAALAAGDAGPLDEAYVGGAS